MQRPRVAYRGEVGEWLGLPNVYCQDRSATPACQNDWAWLSRARVRGRPCEREAEDPGMLGLPPICRVYD